MKTSIHSFRSKDSKDFNDLSKKAPVGFFGCDDRGYLYINGHRIPEHFAGFGRGNVVGVELTTKDSITS